MRGGHWKSSGSCLVSVFATGTSGAWLYKLHGCCFGRRDICTRVEFEKNLSSVVVHPLSYSNAAIMNTPWRSFLRSSFPSPPLSSLPTTRVLKTLSPLFLSFHCIDFVLILLLSFLPLFLGKVCWDPSVCPYVYVWVCFSFSLCSWLYCNTLLQCTVG